MCRKSMKCNAVTMFMLVTVSVVGTVPVLAQDAGSMSFFITSTGPGNGANLGGLQGADRHCQSLAEAAGSTGKTWRAYLSSTAGANQVAVNARDRIGSGPWYNAQGVMVARDINDLHNDMNKLSKENSLSENGEIINGRGDNPNRHDILTGSDMNGMLVTGDTDMTCGNWTGNGEGSAMVGHHDRQGGGNGPSWNAAHGSRGCSQENLRSSGGDGLFYCFAID